jgi:hypothetical protein
LSSLSSISKRIDSPLVLAGRGTITSGIYAPVPGAHLVSHEEGAEAAKEFGAYAFLEYAGDARNGPARVLQAAAWLALQGSSMGVAQGGYGRSNALDGPTNGRTEVSRKPPKVRLSSSRRRLGSVAS